MSGDGQAILRLWTCQLPPDRDAPPRRSPTDSHRSTARALIGLAVAWTALDLLHNVRYPAPASIGWSLLPSLDVTVLLAVVALLARSGRRAPRAFVVVVAVATVAVRLFRFGDGITLRYFNQQLSLGFDLPMAGELVRLLQATVSPGLVALIGLGAVAIVAGVAWVAAWAVRLAERAFADPVSRRAFAGMAALAWLMGLLAPRGVASGRFGGSLVPHLTREIAFAAHLDRYRAGATARIAATDAHLRALPHELAKLGGADVLLFFVESYGATVVDDPAQARILDPVFRDAGAALARDGFTVATSLLDSPTTSGRSWLAHETITTGLWAADRVVDDLIQRAHPVTMADFFRQTGYRTVFAQPANRYRSMGRWVYGFDAVYSGWDMGYRGPGFRWANIPDQYTLDFIHRHEIAAAGDPPPRPPLLVAYALVSSHAPWSEQPRLVDDWSRLGDGSVYQALPVDHYPITWTTLARGGSAYAQSIAYDLRVLVDYVTRFVAGDTLVIVLGDHQPVAEITGFSASRAVPVHVMSRRRALIAPFLARGYQPGQLQPHRTAVPPERMDSFLPHLLVDFSGPPRP